MTKVSKLDKILLMYVGDNVGCNCECEPCKNSRKVVKKAIKEYTKAHCNGVIGEDEEVLDTSSFLGNWALVLTIKTRNQLKADQRRRNEKLAA